MKVHRMLAKGRHQTNNVRPDVFLVVSIWRNNSSDVEVASDIGHQKNWIVSYVIWEASSWFQSFTGHWHWDKMLAACSQPGFQRCIWCWRGFVRCGIGHRWKLGAQWLVQMASDTCHSWMALDVTRVTREWHWTLACLSDVDTIASDAP
jgi:hypothetical protein